MSCVSNAQPYMLTGTGATGAGCVTLPTNCSPFVGFAIPGGAAWKPALLTVDMIVTNEPTPSNPSQFALYYWNSLSSSKYQP